MEVNQDKLERIKTAGKATKLRHSKMSCKVFQTKVDISSLSSSTIDKLNRLFIEAKWIYNAMLSSKDVNKYDTKSKTVKVKTSRKNEEETFEEREINSLSSQMKQSIRARLFSNLRSLKALKAKGFRTGKLKYKSSVKVVPLVQNNITFRIFRNSKRISIQGLKKPLKVTGLNQIPKNAEIACASLRKSGNDFFIDVTCYLQKEEKFVPDKSIGIDFGCESQLTLSNGIKIKYNLPVSERTRKVDQKIARSIKCHPKSRTRNREKLYAKRQKSFDKTSNRKKDVKNKIVHILTNNYRNIAFQDESLGFWQVKHGKKSNGTALGSVISDLKHKSVNPMVVEKWYPSSQLCSGCGGRQKLRLNDRTYICPSCGLSIDRDVNAAINLLTEGTKNSKSKIPTERREFKPEETVTSAETAIFERIPFVKVSYSL